MSWLVLLGSTNSFVKIVYDLTEIFMSPAKKFLDVIGLSNTVFDFSAMLVILVLEIIKIVIFYIISVIFR
jgi:uncharacterized protein YggT (Ycf19 family)